MKSFLVIPLLASCSLFSNTPPSVLEAQRQIYAGLQVAEQNEQAVVDDWSDKTQKLIVYYETYIEELRIQINQSPPGKIKEETQANIKKNIENIRIAADKQRESFKKSNALLKQLQEAIYNYMSSTPLTLDNLDFVIIQTRSILVNHEH